MGDSKAGDHSEMSPSFVKSLQEAYQLAFEKASTQEGADCPVIIGRTDSFSPSEFLDCHGDSLVLGDKIYLTASTSWIHDNTAGSIAKWLETEMNTATGRNLIEVLAASGVKPFTNELGCHRSQVKHPDISVSLPAHNMLEIFRVSPSIVGEVAYRNETALNYSGGCWLDEQLQ